jgi:RNA polymerase sigma factor (sigma-70 family)
MDKNDAERFMALFGPHMDQAYNLARWLLGNDATAQDIVQEGCVRAFTALPRFDGRNPKAWLLRIVRNRCYTWLKKNTGERANLCLDDDTFNEDAVPELADHRTPEDFLIQAENQDSLGKALDKLPVVFREAIIMKELEGLSYKEIASITEVPIGTVMSRLARGRALLKSELGKLVFE